MVLPSLVSVASIWCLLLCQRLDVLLVEIALAFGRVESLDAVGIGFLDFAAQGSYPCHSFDSLS